MNEPINIDIETVRAEALRKLGRNVVNFSKIEAALKYLISISKFGGTEETILEKFHRNQAKVHKQTLGKLVHEFYENVVDDSKVETTTASSNSEISLYFKIAYDDPDFLASHKRALFERVAERNKLIHQDLAFLDTSCVEDYRQLISLLDEQNPRLLAHLEELRLIIESVENNRRIIGDPG